MIGVTVGELTVIEETPERSIDGQILWKCQCSCGNTILVSGLKLRKNQVTSCGCKRRLQSAEMVGQQFGKLTVIAKDEERSQQTKKTYWICQCECGNTKSVRGTSLRAGETKSCGCLQKQAASITGKQNVKDLTNQVFGKLTVIKRGTNQGSKVSWICKCECGNEVEVLSTNLVQGYTQSCGCINYSIGEQNIERILQDNNIIYNKQFAFPDLPRRYFDFAIFDEQGSLHHLIEFDGPQHYNTKLAWYNEEQVQRDLEKDLYCKNHNIPLVRIPYSFRDNITLELLNIIKKE